MLCSLGDTTISGWAIIKNKWLMSHVLCEINVFLQYWVALVDINMIWVLYVSKLIWVMNPMNSRTRKRSIGYILATSRLQEPYVGSVQHFPDPMCCDETSSLLQLQVLPLCLPLHARLVEMARPEHHDPGPKHYRRHHGYLVDNICQQDRWNQRAVYRNHADSFYCLLYLICFDRGVFGGREKDHDHEGSKRGNAVA